ncbi:hypothetical protein RUM44_012856 [Polyplax serrata]|uniref:Protein arginine methyltransferase NDUFAF7 n=1 Tax=Polyplax serrata TaxID=468196 RepID=A0ABR1BGB4_POLSC
MRLFKWAVVRNYGSYVKVSRPTGFKVIQNPVTDKSQSLAKALHLKIKAGGPITVADYMKTCLTNPSLGYYMQKNVIGHDGDFITSPEITQLFGEIIGVWIYHEFSKIGSPKPWQIIELGPGRGTFIKDIVQTLKTLKATSDLSIHLVEVSPQLATLQTHNLCNDVIGIGMVQQTVKGNKFYRANKINDEIPVYWYEKLENVPKAFSVILAHEFFDALPIHKFQKVENEWREVLINSTAAENGTEKFDYAIAEKESPIAKLLIDKNEKREHLEVSVRAGEIAREVAQRLEEFGGFSLFIDYGHDGDKTDTFRAFKKHQLMDPLNDPGTADLTADVDFSFLRSVMKDKVVVLGPVEQGEFLKRLGIEVRLQMLLKNAKGEEAQQLESCYRMIVDNQKMGSRYKCFATFPLVLQDYLKKYPVAGFS